MTDQSHFTDENDPEVTLRVRAWRLVDAAFVAGIALGAVGFGIAGLAYGRRHPDPSSAGRALQALRGAS